MSTAARISELWSDETCTWTLRYLEDGYVWCVEFEWSSEYDNPHTADWAAYTWTFYGATPDQAMAVALVWLEELAAFGTAEALGVQP